DLPPESVPASHVNRAEVRCGRNGQDADPGDVLAHLERCPQDAARLGEKSRTLLAPMLVIDVGRRPHPPVEMTSSITGGNRPSHVPAILPARGAQPEDHLEVGLVPPGEVPRGLYCPVV